jgi:hypothetical protein
MMKYVCSYIMVILSYCNSLYGRTFDELVAEENSEGASWM